MKKCKICDLSDMERDMVFEFYDSTSNVRRCTDAMNIFLARLDNPIRVSKDGVYRHLKNCLKLDIGNEDNDTGIVSAQKGSFGNEKVGIYQKTYVVIDGGTNLKEICGDGINNDERRR